MDSEIFSLSFRRFEFKYHLPRALADRLVPQLLNYMDWDPFAQEKEFYRVNSLYWDSANFQAFHDKLDGYFERKKIRIRYYGDDFASASPHFFEIKRKKGDAILKNRMDVGIEDVVNFISDSASIKNLKCKDESFVDELLYEIFNKQLKPAVLVSYLRKPFISKFDSKFRVTFDYEIMVAQPTEELFVGHYKSVNDELVVMEVKFNGALPRWFHKEVIEMYSLQKDTFSKYCSGIESCYGFSQFS